MIARKTDSLFRSTKSLTQLQNCSAVLADLSSPLERLVGHDHPSAGANSHLKHNSLTMNITNRKIFCHTRHPKGDRNTSVSASLTYFFNNSLA